MWAIAVRIGMIVLVGVSGVLTGFYLTSGSTGYGILWASLTALNAFNVFLYARNDRKRSYHQGRVDALEKLKIQFRS